VPLIRVAVKVVPERVTVDIALFAAVAVPLKVTLLFVSTDITAFAEPVPCAVTYNPLLFAAAASENK